MSSNRKHDDSPYARREPRTRTRDPESTMDPARAYSQAPGNSSSSSNARPATDGLDYDDHLSPQQSLNGRSDASGHGGRVSALNIRLDGDDDEDHMDGVQAADSASRRARSRSAPGDRSSSGKGKGRALTSHLSSSHSSTAMGDDISYDEESWRKDDSGSWHKRKWVNGREILDHLDDLTSEGTFMYGMAEDGARVTAAAARIRMFMKRSANLVTPLIPLDELPPTFTLPGIARTLTSSEAYKFAGSRQYPELFPRAQIPFEPVYTTGTPGSRSAAAPGSVGVSGSSAGPAPGIKQEPSDQTNMVPDDQTWTDRAGHYTRLLSDQWARQGKVLPTSKTPGFGAFPKASNDGNQVYNPMTKGVFGRKLFCSHWLRTGECDFTQQGCNYLHLMPDLDTMELLGMKQYPRWFRELPRDAQNETAAEFDPRGLDMPAGSASRPVYNSYSPPARTSRDRRGPPAVSARTQHPANHGPPPPPRARDAGRRAEGRSAAPRRDPPLGYQTVNAPRYSVSMPPPPSPYDPNQQYELNAQNPGAFTGQFDHRHANSQFLQSPHGAGIPRPFSPLISDFGGSRAPTPVSGQFTRVQSRRGSTSSNLMDTAGSELGTWTGPDGSEQSRAGAGTKRKSVPSQSGEAGPKRARAAGSSRAADPSLSPGPVGFLSGYAGSDRTTPPELRGEPLQVSAYVEQHAVPVPPAPGTLNSLAANAARRAAAAARPAPKPAQAATDIEDGEIDYE